MNLAYHPTPNPNPLRTNRHIVVDGEGLENACSCLLHEVQTPLVFHGACASVTVFALITTARTGTWPTNGRMQHTRDVYYEDNIFRPRRGRHIPWPDPRVKPVARGVQRAGRCALIESGRQLNQGENSYWPQGFQETNINPTNR